MQITKITIKNLFLIFVTAQVFVYCSTKRSIATGAVDNTISAKNIIKNHYKNQLDFKTIRGRIRVDYNDGNSTKGFTMSFRMEKDNTIWMSAPLSMAKTLITPDRASFYSKLDNTYFDGDFSYLTELLGVELNFEKVQNLLLGQAIFDLESEPYNAIATKDAYQLKPVKDAMPLKKLFHVEPTHFKMALQQLSQPEAKRILRVNYKSYQQVAGNIFPDEIVITAEDGPHQTTIALEYKNIEFNQNVSFPYRIPKGYKEITVK